MAQSSAINRFFLSVDAAFEGRRINILLFFAFLQSVVSPFLDSSIDDIKRIQVLKSAAKSIDAVGAVGLEAFSLLAVLLLGGMGLLLLGGRIAALTQNDSTDSQEQQPWRAVLGSLWRFIVVEYRLMQKKSTGEAFLWICALSFVILRAIKSMLAVVRWFVWENIIAPQKLDKTPLASALENVYFLEGYLSLLAMLAILLLTAIFALYMWRKPSSLSASGEGALRELRRLRSENPVLVRIDEKSEQQCHQLGSLFQGSIVADVLQTLRTIKDQEEHEKEWQVRDAVAEALLQKGYHVDVEYNIQGAGQKRRIDLVVGGVVAIEIKRGLHTAAEKDRMLSQVTQYSTLWQNRGPVLLFLSHTSAEHATTAAAQATQWNQTVEPPQAPLLVMY